MNNFWISCRILIVTVLALVFSHTAGPHVVTFAQADPPPCQFVYDVPFHNIKTTCIENVFADIQEPEAFPTLMNLTFAPDGTLFFVRTSLGEIWAMQDVDQDQFLDEPYPLVTDLTLPIDIAFFDEMLYILTTNSILRVNLSDNNRTSTGPTSLIDLPVSDQGLWPGSIGIGPDQRLYVSLSANCFACDQADDIETGQILSYDLEGQDARVEATGFRYPAGFTWHPQTQELWVVDSGNVSYSDYSYLMPDELNRVTSGEQYGFPTCYGNQDIDVTLAAMPDASERCAATQPPVLLFPPQSTPSGIAFYESSTFPEWADGLLVVFRGSWFLPEPTGYSLDVFGFDSSGTPTGTKSRVAPTSDDAPWKHQPLAQFSLGGRGFFPHHPIDVAVSSEGWIYLSIQEGRIIRFRPR